MGLLKFLFSNRSGKNNPKKTPTKNKNVRKSVQPSMQLTFSYESREEKFLKQAKAYEYKKYRLTKHIPLKSYYTTYDDLNKNQAKWYFYWRSQVRKGRFLETDLSYIFLHIYELINNVGVSNPKDGFKKLVRLWISYRKHYPQLDRYLTVWLFDYMAVNKLSHERINLLKNKDLSRIISTTMPDYIFTKTYKESLSNIPISAIGSLIDYDIIKSRFYLDGNQDLVIGILNEIFQQVDQIFLKKYGQKTALRFKPHKTTIRRTPFNGAIYAGTEQNVEIIEVYEYSRNAQYKKLLKSIVKYTENKLREKQSYRGRVKATAPPNYLKTMINRVVEEAGEPKDNLAEYVFATDSSARHPSVNIPQPVHDSFVKTKLKINSRRYLLKAQIYSSRIEAYSNSALLVTPSKGYVYSYDSLSGNQLKWYFYWRAQTRQNNFEKVDDAYILMFANELVHLVGVMDENDAFSQLKKLWMNYRIDNPDTEPFLLSWLISLVEVFPIVDSEELLLLPEAYEFSLKYAPDILLKNHLASETLHTAKLAMFSKFVDYDIENSTF